MTALPKAPRNKSLALYHLHMGGPDADASEMQALRSQRFEHRMRTMGVYFVSSAAQADIAVLTGLLLEGNRDDVLSELARLGTPAVLISAGDAAANGGIWAKLKMPGLAQHTIGHYADVHITVPGSPPTPQALIAALVEGAKMLNSTTQSLEAWED